MSTESSPADWEPRVYGEMPMPPRLLDAMRKGIQSIDTLTIGRLARAAGVGIETIRYYQRRKLLPCTPRQGGVRRYSPDLIGRLHFIKRAQGLGFTLDEVGSLLALEDGADRPTIRAITTERLIQIKGKIAALSAMRRTLSDLLARCAQEDVDKPCPIIASLADPSPTTRPARVKRGAAGGSVRAAPDPLNGE